MALFQFLRKHLSPLFGWARNSAPGDAPQRHRLAEEGLVDPVTGLPRFTEEHLADPIAALAKWLGTDGDRQPGSYGQEWVDSLESRYAIRIPDDFRRYLLHVAPRFEVTDEEVTAWWTPGRIRNIPEEYEHEVSNPAIAAEAGTYLFFADCLIWCWAWAVCCSDGPNRGKVAFIGGPDDFVADSFTEFAERYLRDPGGMANTLPPSREIRQEGGLRD